MQPSQRPNPAPATLARIAALLEQNRIERLASQTQQGGRVPQPASTRDTTAARTTA